MSTHKTLFLPGLALFVFGVLIGFPSAGLAQTAPRVTLSFSPQTGSFAEGATFQVPILLNTKDRSINGIDIKVRFDPDLLSIVDPSSGVSIVGVWLNPPVYDNTRGTASYTGVVPGGIITDSGLIGSITFKAKTTGRTVISIDPSSKILLNDGLGTETKLDLVRAEYDILPKAPEGVVVFSPTHPVESDWYNNNTPVLSWQLDPGVAGFSFELDNKPNTVPDNVIDSGEDTKSYEALKDGLWSFHIKANKTGVWGNAGHFLLRIDTVPPAEFKPKVNFLIAAILASERSLISFFTTDNLSGIDHYEVGVLNKTEIATESPLFVQAESPFQVPINDGDKLEVIVRAIDKAGNVRDASVDVRSHSPIINFLRDYRIHILLGIIILWLILSVLHFLLGHHIIESIRRLRQIMKKENNREDIKPQEKTEERTDQNPPV